VCGRAVRVERPRGHCPSRWPRYSPW
jgi:hypothetical protein